MGEGRDQKINMRAACAELTVALDTGQLQGNAASTAEAIDALLKRLDSGEVSDETAPSLPVGKKATVTEIRDPLKQEKILGAQLENERRRRALAADQGQWVVAADAAALSARALADELDAVAMFLNRLSEDIAGKYELEPRPLRQFVRQAWADQRTRRAAALRARAADAMEPETLEAAQ